MEQHYQHRPLLSQEWSWLKTTFFQDDASKTNASGWGAIIKQAIGLGCKVAIASFSQFPEIIKKYLSEMCKLSPAEMDKITIDAQLPPHPETADKNEQIERIISKMYGTGNRPSSFLFIDDNLKNVQAARAARHTAIYVTADNYVNPSQLFSTIQRMATKKATTTSAQQPTSSAIPQSTAPAGSDFMRGGILKALSPPQPLTPTSSTSTSTTSTQQTSSSTTSDDHGAARALVRGLLIRNVTTELLNDDADETALETDME